LAKDLFKQGAVSLDDFAFSVNCQRPWPVIQRFLEKGLFSFVDYSFAKTAYNHEQKIDEDVACFLCYLMAASRSGHLCISIDQNQLLPDLLTPMESVDAHDLIRLREAILSGSEKVPEGMIQNGMGNDILKPIVRMGPHFYLHRNYKFETEIIEHFNRLSSWNENVDFMPHFDREDRASLTDSQVLSVEKAVGSPLFLLSGGPGTGKSYTAGKIISIYQKTYPQMRIFAAAPTGKAASCLKEKIPSNVEVGTLHALLKIKRSEDLLNRSRTLPYDLIVIDEASMIDLPMFAALLSSVDTTTRLILMGDHRQLPPVESGSVFRDLCQHAEGHKPEIYAQLSECKRSDQKAILDLSESIRSREIGNALISLHHTGESHIRYHEISDQRADLFPSKTDIDRNFPAPQINEPTAESLFQMSGRFRILSPLNVGPYGVKTINQHIWKHFLKGVGGMKYWAIPIIVTKTNYQLDLYNGEIGFLIRHLDNRNISAESYQQRDYALFLDRDGSSYRKMPAAILPPYDHAYALTVHKSQGSEFDHVYFFLPEGSEGFGQEMLYTGITRAKHKLTLFSNDETIKRCVLNHSTKHSVLGSRLLS